MNLGPHAFYIVIAYAFALLIVGGLIVWVMNDHRIQRRSLADFELRGVARRSDKATARTP